ncbi:MAG: tRNA-dihydrouridine synthase family protein [Chloroflexi bacterium]|nr:tRNA-dihydrouridine synthase family protein [Chloroflexota bacterium]
MKKPQAKFPSFHVDDIPVFGDIILAPMDGYSDWPFRSICRQLGSAMSYTEFISAANLINRPPYDARKLHYTKNERPVVYQVYGRHVDEILTAALKMQEMGPDIIDVNMGCPSKSVANGGAGVGLMRTPLKIARIFRKLTAALDVPVTGKIRLGWDDDCRTYRLIARIIEENGGQLIAVHGRTKVQGYGGVADWDAIAEIKAAVKIPVIGNGDVKTVADIQRIKDHTGCDAVMIGRAAIDNPWIFARLDRDDVLPEQVRSLMLDHLQRNLSFYGSERGLVLFRKYATRYLAPYRLPRRLRRRLLTLEAPEDFLALLDEIYCERIEQ